MAVDASGNYRTIAFLGGDVKVAEHAVFGGTRASARVGKLIEFGEVLAGAVHTSGTAFGGSNSATFAAVQGGGGLDFPLASRVAARVQLDARFFSTGRQLRFVAGLAYVCR